MIHLIEALTYRFNAKYNVKATFEIESRAKQGTFTVNGKTYLLLWLAEPRVEDLERMIKKHGKENVILFCRKLYSTGHALLRREGISYLEGWDGKLYFVDVTEEANEMVEA